MRETLYFIQNAGNCRVYVNYDDIVVNYDHYYNRNFWEDLNRCFVGMRSEISVDYDGDLCIRILHMDEEMARHRTKDFEIACAQIQIPKLHQLIRKYLLRRRNLVEAALCHHNKFGDISTLELLDMHDAI